jgi:hypothetical protein
MPRQLVGAGVELAVGQPFAAEDHGLGFRTARDRGLEGLLDRQLGAVRGVGVVPADDQLMPLGRGDQRQLAQARVGIGDDAAQERPVVADGARDRGAVEEVVAVAEGAAETFRGLLHHQHPVELRRRVVEPEWAESQLGQLQRPDRRVAQGENHLEEGRIAQVALGLELVDELLEGQVLVGLGVEGHVAHPPQEFAEGEVAGGAAAQGQDVDEAADQRLGFGAGAVGDGRADDHVAVVGVARDEDLEGGEQGHEERRAVPPAEILEPGGQSLSEAEGQVGALEALRRGPWPVGGQLGEDGSRGQLLFPVFELSGQHLAAQPPTLPESEIGVLDLELGQGRRPVTDEGQVEGDHLVDEQTHGPAVGDHVVQGQEQDVVLLAQP